MADVTVAELQVHMINLQKLRGHEDSSDCSQLVFGFWLSIVQHSVEKVNQPHHYKENVLIFHLTNLRTV
jgi:hypothetical protein